MIKNNKSERNIIDEYMEGKIYKNNLILNELLLNICLNIKYLYFIFYILYFIFYILNFIF